MSVIQVTQHEERINAILYQEPPPRDKSSMSVSKAVKKLKCLKICERKTHATMGEADVTLKPPTQYLKKGDGETFLTNAKGRRCSCLALLVSPTLSRPEHKTRDKEKTFGSCPLRKKQAKCVDKETGDRVNVIKNTWVYQAGYGEAPGYVERRRGRKRREEERYRRELEEQEPLCTAVSHSEREHLLNGLKKKYEELHKEFLLLPMVIDTIPIINRKRNLEKSIKAIEKDLDLIQRNPYIYTYH